MVSMLFNMGLKVGSVGGGGGGGRDTWFSLYYIAQKPSYATLFFYFSL
jgi:hypothetical protein